jgi:hypothetical protein
MIAVATGLYSVLRGETTNTYGDAVDADVVVQAAIPVALMPASQAATRRADDRAQEVEYARGRVAWGTDIRVGDRLRSDADTTVVWAVTGSHTAENAWMSQDVGLDLERAPTT